MGLLEQQIQLLRSHGVDYWADWLEEALERCRRFDTYGLTRILGAYGGMGSLSDLIICVYNGHRIEREDEEEVNKRFMELHGQIYGLASELLKEADSK